jgi:hypothetical protein
MSKHRRYKKSKKTKFGSKKRHVEFKKPKSKKHSRPFSPPRPMPKTLKEVINDIINAKNKLKKHSK